MGHFTFFDQVDNVEGYYTSDHPADHACAWRCRCNEQVVFVGERFGNWPGRCKGNACREDVFVSGILILGGPCFGCLGKLGVRQTVFSIHKDKTSGVGYLRGDVFAVFVDVFEGLAFELRNHH